MFMFFAINTLFIFMSCERVFTIVVLIFFVPYNSINTIHRRLILSVICASVEDLAMHALRIHKKKWRTAQ